MPQVHLVLALTRTKTHTKLDELSTTMDVTVVTGLLMTYYLSIAIFFTAP